MLKIIDQKNISRLQCDHVTTSAYLMSNKVNRKTNNTQKNNIDKVFYYISNVPCDSKTIGRTTHDHEENYLLRGRSDTLIKRNYLIMKEK